MHRLQQNPNHLHFSLNKAQLWACPGPAPAPSLTAAPPGAELWVLSVHTLHVPRALWGETGPRPPFPWEEGQVPGHLTSSTYSPPPPTIMHAPAGPAFLETQVTLKNSAFSMCLLLLQGLGAPPDPPSCGPGPGPNPTCPGAQSSSTRSSLWDGVSALPPPSVDFSALLSSPGNPLQPPPCISPSSNFGQRTPGLLGPTVVSGQGDMAFARTWGVRRRPQPSPMAPWQPRPVRVPCPNRPRSAVSLLLHTFSSHSSSGVLLLSILVKEGRLFPVCHRGCFPGGLVGWAGPGASTRPRPPRGSDPAWSCRAVC